MKYHLWLFLLFTVVFKLNAQEADTTKSTYHKEGAGGPASTPNQIVGNDLVWWGPVIKFPISRDFFNPYFNFKKSLNDKYGFRFSIDYNLLFAHATADSAADISGSGILRFLGAWEAFRRKKKNSGTLIFKIETRHAYGNLETPQWYGYNNGYYGLTGTLYSNIGWFINHLYWQQYLLEDKLVLFGGKLDVTDFVDILGYGSPWTGFQNMDVFAFGTIAYPDQSFGIGGTYWLKEKWYTTLLWADAYGVLTEFTFFESGNKTYKYGELGWSPNRSRRFETNYHLSFFQMDGNQEKALTDGWGINFSASQQIKNWNLFFRMGYSEGNFQFANKSISGGFTRPLFSQKDHFGLGYAWTVPSISSFNGFTVRNNQHVVESYYRFTLVNNIQITPSVQYIQSPATNPFEESFWLVQLRTRFIF